MSKKLSKWGRYLEPGQDYNDRESFSIQAKAVCEILDDLPVGSLVDLGCNKGWYCGYARRLGHQVVGLDFDESSLEIARQRGFEVAQVDILKTPLRVPQSYPADTLLCLSMIHHICLLGGMELAKFARYLMAFGASRLVLEWVGPEDRVVKRWLSRGKLTSVPKDYHLENLLAEFQSIFTCSRRLLSGPGHADYESESERTVLLLVGPDLP